MGLLTDFLGSIRVKSSVRTSMRSRFISLLVFIPTLSVLVLARVLTPSTKGVGTHLQLGLSGCSFLTWTGWPCPMCGMTTTFAHIADFELIAGTRNQPFGAVLFVMCLALFVTSGIDILFTRQWLRKMWQFTRKHDLKFSAFLLVSMLAGWTYKITMWSAK